MAIGGRSTEMILGRHENATTLESYRVGSVGWSMKYFADGLWTTSAFNAAEIAAKAVLDEAQMVESGTAAAAKVRCQRPVG